MTEVLVRAQKEENFQAPQSPLRAQRMGFRAQILLCKLYLGTKALPFGRWTLQGSFPDA